WGRRARVTVSASRASTAVGLEAVRGRVTSIPRYIIGAVSMKISSSTSTTSTSGMMLISASDAPKGRRPPAPGPTLNANFGGPRGLGHRPREPIEQLQREAPHLRRPVLEPVDEVVAGHDRRNRRPEPPRRPSQPL